MDSTYLLFELDQFRSLSVFQIQSVPPHYEWERDPLVLGEVGKSENFAIALPLQGSESLGFLEDRDGALIRHGKSGIEWIDERADRCPCAHRQALERRKILRFMRVWR